MTEKHLGRDNRGQRYARVSGVDMKEHIRRYSKDGHDRGFFCSVAIWERFMHRVVAKR